MDMQKRSIEVVCCYARKDQDFLLALRSHLTPLQRDGLITLWAGIDIDTGAEWDQEIRHHLDTAQIILLLISPDFMESDYCYGKEMQRALERHEMGSCRVIPILLRPTYWKSAPFSSLQILPTDARPITLWHDRDEAFYSIVQGILKVVNKSKALLDSAHPAGQGAIQSIHIPPKPRTPPTWKKVALIVVAVLVICAGFALATIYISNLNSQENIKPTATANANATGTASSFATQQALNAQALTASVTASALGTPYGGKLLIRDPMSGPGSAFGWSYGNDTSGDKCTFENGAYHVFGDCFSQNIVPPKFAFEIHLVAFHNCGEIFINFSIDFISLSVCQNGDYYVQGLASKYFQAGSANSVLTGLDQSNVIGIVSDGIHVTLYINSVKLTSFLDKPIDIGSGAIFLNGEDPDVALAHKISTAADNREVIYTNAFLWSL